jgi:tetratricopeptide (TPR) repeat protein
MKPILCLLLSLGLAAGPLAADGHPMASRIRAYREANPIEPRIPVLLIWVSQQSEQLDTAGREALTRGRYGDAVDLLRRAVDSDEDNSMAWYDLARAYARAGDYP